jgi:hypothetical protein
VIGGQSSYQAFCSSLERPLQNILVMHREAKIAANDSGNNNFRFELSQNISR